MPRGGARKGAGKKNTWNSGSKFNETKVIRIPIKIADKVLKLAHDLDSGLDYELETKSLKQENKRLKDELTSIGDDQLKLPLFSDTQLNIKELEVKRDKALGTLKVGEQSKSYKNCKKVLNYFIKSLLD